MVMNPTVFVVDDDQAVRDSLRWLIESVNLSVETYSSATGFLDDYNIGMVGCLVLDVRMPDMSGLQLQKQLNENKYRLPIIFITGHGDVPMAVRAMKDGAMEFIEKPFSDQELLDCVQTALDKDREYQKQRIQLSAIAARVANLTPREKEVMRLVVKGFSNKRIANELSISIKTVEFHRSRIMEKMHAESLLQLVDMVREAA